MGGFDVGIIGAGIHGASVAYHLASRSVKTVVFEKDAPAAGPTGRSSGICRAYYTNEFLALAARESIEMLASFPEHTNGREAGFRRTGFLFLHPAEDADRMRATAARLTSLGIPVEVLDLDRLAAEFPAFDLADVGIAGWEANAGYADPAGATLGLLRRAEELGAETRIGEAVVRVEPSVGGGATVTASSGTRTFCSRLLIAAGPWTAPLVQQVGVNLPLTVERHVVGVVRWRRAAEMPFGHADLVAGYYCKPERPDLYCLGWLHPAEGADPDRYVETVTDGEAETLGQALAARVPAMEEAELFGGWAGLYDVSPDWQPVIGEVAEGIFVDAGTSGHGFKLAPALGKHVADLVTGGRTDPGLAQFHPARFGQHKLLPAGYRAARILG